MIAVTPQQGRILINLYMQAHVLNEMRAGVCVCVCVSVKKLLFTHIIEHSSSSEW